LLFFPSLHLIGRQLVLACDWLSREGVAQKTSKANKQQAERIDRWPGTFQNNLEPAFSLELFLRCAICLIVVYFIQSVFQYVSDDLKGVSEVQGAGEQFPPFALHCFLKHAWNF